MACPHTRSDHCPVCAETLSEESLSAGDTMLRGERADAEGTLPPGAPIGRYLVLDRLGQGGMGVLYTAHDPQLQRVVAIKVLRSRADKEVSQVAGRWAVVAAGLAVVLGATGLAAWSSWRQARACQGAEALLGGVWDAPVKQRSEASFLATGAPFAKASWALTRDALDGWANQWIAARTEACQATRVRGEQTERQLLLRFECLDHSLAELGALAEAFGAADQELISSAGTATSKLSPLRSCANVKNLEDRRAPPPELADAARELSQQLAQGRALLAAGRFTDARARLAPTAKRAQELKLVALEGESLEALGDLELQSRNFVESRSVFQAAVRAAEVAGDDAAVARILSRLITVVGWRLDKPDEARTWAALASGIVERIGGDRLIEARIAEGVGDTEWQAGQRAVSLVAYRKSLALYLEEEGEESVDVARLRSSVGWVLTEQGELSLANDELQRSRAIRERLLGPGHPTLASTWTAAWWAKRG